MVVLLDESVTSLALARYSQDRKSVNIGWKKEVSGDCCKQTIRVLYLCRKKPRWIVFWRPTAATARPARGGKCTIYDHVITYSLKKNVTRRGSERLHVYSSYLIVVRPLFSQSVSCYSTLLPLGSLISESGHFGRIRENCSDRRPRTFSICHCEVESFHFHQIASSRLQVRSKRCRKIFCRFRPSTAKNS